MNLIHKSVRSEKIIIRHLFPPHCRFSTLPFCWNGDFPFTRGHRSADELGVPSRNSSARDTAATRRWNGLTAALVNGKS